MPLQLLEIGFHVEIHAIEWHDFEHETQFHGVVVAWIEFSLEIISLVDGTYELIQGPDEDTFEVQINITEDNEDLNVNPKSESELHEVQPTSWN